MSEKPPIDTARSAFHEALLANLLSVTREGVPNIADRDNAASIGISTALLRRMGQPSRREKEAGQTSGKRFEQAVAFFLRETFTKLSHLRPGEWEIREAGSGGMVEISNFEQYQHLARLREVIAADPAVAAALGSDYLITPDVVVPRKPETEKALNSPFFVASPSSATLTPLRARNHSAVPEGGKAPLLLHASVSCKWTLRSDRAQNARSEALNLIRNRKGRVPHIVAVTAEPLPSRIASLALGTSDLDCVYHTA